MRPRHLLICLSVALPLTACDGTGPEDPGPLVISSITPTPGITDAETGVAVEVVFNQAIDPATLTSETFRIERGGVPLATVLSYAPATRTARAVAPFLPGTTYDVQMTPGVRTPHGTALSRLELWSFATRAWQTTTVDASSRVGAGTSLAVDASGRLHLTYAGDLNYATCAGDCTVATNWQLVSVDTTVFVDRNSLVVDAAGGLHVGYRAASVRDVKYATCAADCALAVNWDTVTVAETGSGDGTSLAVDAGGRLHMTYHSSLEYATCEGDCAAAANWQALTVDASSGVPTSIAIGPSGTLHVAYPASGGLKYATCAANCAVQASWQTVQVDAVGSGPSLAVDASGGVHVSYQDDGGEGSRSLKYATCSANCVSAANWQTLAVDADGFAGSFADLAVDGGGRVHVSYNDDANEDLKYATCAAACTIATSWQVATVDALGAVGEYTSLAVDARGRIHISHRDDDSSFLKYTQ